MHTNKYDKSWKNFETKVDLVSNVLGTVIVLMFIGIGVIAAMDYFAVVNGECPNKVNQKVVSVRQMKDGSVICSYVRNITGLAATN